MVRNEHVAGLGRWLSPDPMGGDVSNPQSLNRYAYALNNPETLTDPLGTNPNAVCLEANRGSVMRNSCAGEGPASLGSGNGFFGGGFSIDGGMSLGWSQWGGITGLSNSNEFDLLNIPVTSSTWVQAGQLTNVIGGVSYPGAFTPGYWTRTTIGNALSFFGLQLSPSSSGPVPLRSVNTPPALLRPSIGPMPPTMPTQPQRITVSCMAAALIENFAGDDAHAGVTLTVNIGAAIALGLVRQAAPSLLPGPGWLYVGVAALWDVGTVAKSYGDCRNGGLSVP
jgi:hypothetical protein